MKKLKAVSAVLLSLAVIVTVAGSVLAYKSQNEGGGYTGICDISSESREWIIENFGGCEDTEELLLALTEFATENFTYELQRYFPFQVADFDSFISTKDFYGMCFEFAVFAKTVALVWAEEKGVALHAYICNTYYYKDGKEAHSYNFFTLGDTTYCLDLTGDVNDVKNGREPFGPAKCLVSKEQVDKALYSPYRSNFI